jgi:hypothetical protein
MPSKPTGHMHMKPPELFAWQVPPFRQGFGEHGLGGATVIALSKIHAHPHTHSCNILITRASKNLPMSQIRPVYLGGQ